MSRSAVGVLASAACVALACTDVRIVQQGGNGGEGPVGGFATDGGFDATGGFAGVGGFEAGGAPGVVPNCEELQLTGEPILLANTDGPPWDQYVSVARLAGGRVGLVYKHDGTAEGTVRTRTIEGAESFWPPTVTDAVTVYDGFVGNPPRLDSAPLNGAFTLSFGGLGIYAFEQAGALREMEPDWYQAFVHSGAMTPFDVVTVEGENFDYGLLSFDSLSDASPTSVTALPISGCRAARMATSDTGSLLSLGTDYYCDGEARVDFFRTSPDGVELAAGFELPSAPREQWLEPRPGGYWYFTSSESEGTYAYALDESGVPAIPPWHDDYQFGSFTPTLRTWRNRFVGSHRDDLGVSIFVSDGVNRTSMAPIPGTEAMQSISEANDLAIAVMGLDSGSFVLGYPTQGGILLARAACFTPIK